MIEDITLTPLKGLRPEHTSGLSWGPDSVPFGSLSHPAAYPSFCMNASAIAM